MSTPGSPAAPPLEDDDLLSEILLRLPPQPSSLPRASAVCGRWRSLVSDPRFSRRFRIHHRRNAPLLGFFERFGFMPFLPALEAPNRIPPGRFCLQRGADDEERERYTSLGCRHGLFLIFLEKSLQILVWDPVTGDQHRIALPPGVATYAAEMAYAEIHGAVLRPAGDGQHFQVVLAVVDIVPTLFPYQADGEMSFQRHEQALACVYSSKTSLWGNLISTPLPYQANGSRQDAVLVGSSLYWVLDGNCAGILEFDLEKQSLTVIGVPLEESQCFTVIRAEGGGIGFVFVSDCSAQLWQRETDCDGGTSWGLRRTIELDKLISPRLRLVKRPLVIVGFAEENNVVLLWTFIGLFMIHLDSLKFEMLCKTGTLSCYHPFESIFTAGQGWVDQSQGDVSMDLPLHISTTAFALSQQSSSQVAS